MTFDDFVARFPHARHVGVDEVKATCPLPDHRDSDPSVSITLAGDKILLFDHGGCSREQILHAVGCTMADLFLDAPALHTNGAGRRLITTFDYTDETGELLYQVVRAEPKEFRQRRPDGRGGWTWKLGDVRKVPYRLHQLQSQRTVQICEGEKDAERLWALHSAATTNAGGAGKWTAALTADVLRAAGREYRLIVSLLVLRERTRLSLRAERVGRALRKAGPQPVVLTLNPISGHSRTRIQDGEWPAWLRRPGA